MEQLRGQNLKKFIKKLRPADKDIVLVLENIQYARNVASIFRSAEAFHVKRIVLTGISKTPPFGKELRKVSRSKEDKVPWEYEETTGKAIKKLVHQGYSVSGLEITDASEDIKRLKGDKIALILGNETYGIVKNTLAKIDKTYFIPIFGKGASLSVGTAGAIALYSILNNN